MAKILVVDDEIGVRELLSDILTDEGSVVVTAESAEAARQCLSRESFDLILLDVWMPDADGVSLLKELSACHLLHCPIITEKYAGSPRLQSREECEKRLLCLKRIMTS